MMAENFLGCKFSWMVRPNLKFSRVHVANGRTNIISRCKPFFETSTSFDEIIYPNIVSDIEIRQIPLT